MIQYAAYIDKEEVKFVEGEFIERKGLLFLDKACNLQHGWWTPAEVQNTKALAIGALYDKCCVKSRNIVSELNELETQRHIVANAFMRSQ